MQNRREFLRTLGLGSAGLAIPGCATSTAGGTGKTRQPNVLLIIADDQGYGDFGAYSPLPSVRTPNLDRLAARGVRFSNAYATSPICSPSRAGLITGRYQQRWGNYWYAQGGLPERETTLAQRLRAIGYATGYIGKVHYGTLFKGCQSSMFPLNHGFDYYYGYTHATIDYRRHRQVDAQATGPAAVRRLGVGPFWRQRERIDQDGYSTELFGQQACAFIRRHRERPFFLTLAFNAVHLFVHQLPLTYLKKHGLQQIADWDPKVEPYLRWYRRVTDGLRPEAADPELRRLYLGCLEYMDREVGHLLDTLEELQLREDTLIVYLSDNGGSPRTMANNYPLSGYKYTLSEGGIRVPFVVSQPGRLPENRVIAATVSALDIVPTVMHAVRGRSLPEGVCDGTSLLPLLTGETGKGHQTLCWDTGWEWAIRDGDWKLRVTPREKRANLHPVPAGKYLYNLRKDPGEKNNCYTSVPGKVGELTTLHRRWRMGMQPLKKRHRPD